MRFLEKMSKAAAANGKSHQMMRYISVNIFRVFCPNEIHELPTSQSLRMLVKYARTLSQTSGIIMSGGRAWTRASSSSTLGDSDALNGLRTVVNQYLLTPHRLSLNKPQQSGSKRNGLRPRYSLTDSEAWKHGGLRGGGRKARVFLVGETGIITRESKKMRAWNSKNTGPAGVEGHLQSFS